MRSSTRQFECKTWPISTGPIVVFAQGKSSVKSTIIFAKERDFSYSRDGPIIFHMRDGPPDITGPPGAIRQTCGPPRNRFDLARQEVLFAFFYLLNYSSCRLFRLNILIDVSFRKSCSFFINL